VNTALVQVLGAVAYGELKAYEQATADLEAAGDEEARRRFRRVGAEERRHYEGFVARLEAMGADPDRAMRPYRAALDRYHAGVPSDSVAGAVFDYLGEGVADDLLTWLRKVVDSDTAAFIDTVIADEIEHEAAVAADVRSLLDTTPGGRARAASAARQMVVHMLWSGRDKARPMAAFLRLGRPAELLGGLLAGHARRLRAIGVGPLGLPVP
jgi:DNA-binding ferritin-like protein (Dps family)